MRRAAALSALGSAPVFSAFLGLRKTLYSFKLLNFRQQFFNEELC